MDFFKGKRILIGVTGGVAAYKAVILCSLLRKVGAELRIILTENAQRFVSKLTFESVSGFPVYTSMWEKSGNEIDHIALKDFAELTIIAPATANIIGKTANGICDDLLSTVMLGLKSPIFIVPAMNTDMYENSFFQENLEKLRSKGIFCLEPESGNLACGVTGKGKMPEPEKILGFIEKNLKKEKSKNGKKVLVTLGATREYFDSVRFLSNPSTGKMGSAIVTELLIQGFDVIAVCGNISSDIDRRAERIDVVSAIDMLKAVEEKIYYCQAFISTAAVADYRPEKIFKGKLKKESSDLNNISFVRNPDILKKMSEEHPDIFMTGFAAEYDNLIENGQKKLLSKSLDLLVVNDISRKDIGFGSEKNEVIIFEKGSEIPVKLNISSKKSIAREIVKKIADKLK